MATIVIRLNDNEIRKMLVSGNRELELPLSTFANVVIQSDKPVLPKPFLLMISDVPSEVLTLKGRPLEMVSDWKDAYKYLGDNWDIVIHCSQVDKISEYEYQSIKLDGLLSYVWLYPLTP